MTHFSNAYSMVLEVLFHLYFIKVTWPNIGPGQTNSDFFSLIERIVQIRLGSHPDITWLLDQTSRGCWTTPFFSGIKSKVISNKKGLFKLEERWP